MLTDFDWRGAAGAVLCGATGPPNAETRGEIALCEGYLNLIRNPEPPDSERSETQFQMAAADLPQSPDPILAWRGFMLCFLKCRTCPQPVSRNRTLGLSLRPREFEQEADGYLYRAEFELNRAVHAASVFKAEQDRWFEQSWDDLERARILYEPIYGFSTVNESLDRLHADRASLISARSAARSAAVQLQTKSSHPQGRQIPTTYGHH